MPQWKAPHPAPNELIFDLLDLPPFIVQTLFNRGYRTAPEINRLLSPDDSTPVGNPFALAGMDAAVARVSTAIARDEKIVVYSDFDVDGICSAVLLVQVLSHMGAAVNVYIPHRVEEGYGLHKAAIDHLAGQGVRLLVTADCGTSSVPEIAHAHSLGLDVIVTDHHDVHGELPPAIAVLNPHRPDCAYPFKELAGVGVAYKLAQALLQGTQAAEAAEQFIDLVALGTVVDVAPLVGENRTLVRRGLAAMKKSPRLGLKALLEVARIKPEEIDAGCLGFVIGPRLNAAGRLDTALSAYQLLATASPEEARVLARQLEEQNRERQRLLEEALVTAREDAAAQAKDNKLVFVGRESYQPGIIGLIAGRLVEAFYRPAVVVAYDEPLSRGSCRSIPEFNIAQALDECHDLLDRHGGHAQAAGFSVRTERLADVRQRLAGIAARELAAQALEPVVAVDCVIPLSQATWETLRWLERMEPFGPGNAAPLFQSNDVRVRSARQSGNSHLRLAVTDGRLTWGAIAFRQGERANSLKEGDRVDLLYNLEGRQWNGEPDLQLVVRDLRNRS